jgi:type VI secretion system protein ImpA
MIELNELAVPLEGDNPAGVNLEYDPLYMEMDGLAAEVGDNQIGDSIIKGHSPDWKHLSKNCRELWKKTRDLRVASYLVVAETAMGGLEELVKGLKLLLFLVNDLWDAFYPRLDPADDNDPIERLNILSMLSPESGAVNDLVMFISRFRATRIVSSSAYTIRDLLISTREIVVQGKEIDASRLKAELKSTAGLRERLALANEARDLINGFCEAMNGKMSGGYVVSMESLSHEVSRLITFLGQLQGPEKAEEPEAAQGGTEGASEGGVSKNVDIASYQAVSRSDALMLLQKGADYFRKQEPNSPVPLLIDRAMRFSEMNFIDLLQDIVPDALSRGREIFGIKEKAH